MTDRTYEYHVVKREGCRAICITKAEAKVVMEGYPQAICRSFSNFIEARNWLESPESGTLNPSISSSIAHQRKRKVNSNTALPVQESISIAGPSNSGPSREKKRRITQTNTKSLVVLTESSSSSSIMSLEETPKEKALGVEPELTELEEGTEPAGLPAPPMIRQRDDEAEEEEGNTATQGEPKSAMPLPPVTAQRRDYTTPIPRPNHQSPPGGSVSASNVKDGSAVTDGEKAVECLTVAGIKLSKKEARQLLEADSSRGDLSAGPVGGASEPKLSGEQIMVLEMIKNGCNIFFTGSAGTGKSVLLRAIIQYFRKKDQEVLDLQKVGLDDVPLHSEAPNSSLMDVEDVMADDKAEVRRARPTGWELGITAPTGIAGVNIGGTTIHSWSGIGRGEEPREVLLEQILRNSSACQRWRECRALLIDEISMVSAELFDKLEWLGRKIRKNDRPFGGLQVILCGDFFQLPPVSKREQPKARYAFEAKSWDSVLPAGSLVSLTKVFRQADAKFVVLLDSLRRGSCSNTDLTILAACDRVVKYEDGIEPVSLYPTKEEVQRINKVRLESLETPMIEYRSRDSPGIDSRDQRLSTARATALLDKFRIWPQALQLKVGAMVMLISNMGDDVLVNGSTGVVVDFMTLADAKQEGIYLPPRAALYSHPPSSVWPIVKFAYSKHAQGQQYDRAIVPGMSVDVMNAKHKPEATRDQVPLILAWALTIHKSQGQTLERVRVDMRKIFESGQAYVAISRVVSLEGLELKNMSRSKVMSNRKVNTWDRQFAPSSGGKASKD